MNYYQRYVKYKTKYMELREWLKLNENMSGGNEPFFSMPDEIYFWGRQMMEHTSFLDLGLHKEEYNKGARGISEKWKSYLQTQFWDKGIMRANPDDKVFLEEAEIQRMDNISTDEVTKLIKLTLEYKRKLLNELNKNEWMGFIFAPMVEHMIKETEYFYNKISSQPFTYNDEIKFITVHHKTEMAATEKLIDPSLEELDNKIKNFIINMNTNDREIMEEMSEEEIRGLIITSWIMSGELTNLFKGEIMDKIDRKELKSIIPPVLAHHIYREFIRFTTTLAIIKKNSE